MASLQCLTSSELNSNGTSGAMPRRRLESALAQYKVIVLGACLSLRLNCHEIIFPQITFLPIIFLQIGLPCSASDGGDRAQHNVSNF